MKLSRLTTAITVSLIGVLTSCVHRDIEYELTGAVYLDVVFDWSNEPEANPETMSLYLFPTDGKETQRYEFIGREGGTIRVLPGTYDVICLNSDVLDINFNGTDLHSSFELTTNPLNSLVFDPLNSVRSFELPRAPGAENEPLSGQPPLMWASSVTTFELFDHKDSKRRSGNQELRLYPDRIVDTYVVTIKKITNIDLVNSISATISGMSSGYLPGSGTPNSSLVTLPVALSVNREQAAAEGSFLTFGHCPNSQKKHKLMVYVIRNDRSKYFFEFDVSELAHYPPDENNVHHIDVELLDVPSSGSGNISGNPTVSDWHTVNINLNM